MEKINIKQVRISDKIYQVKFEAFLMDAQLINLKYIFFKNEI
jgi:hypothetical protein